jgi:hypothetical protein
LAAAPAAGQDDAGNVSNIYWRNHWDWFDRSYQPYYSRQFNRSLRSRYVPGQFGQYVGPNVPSGYQTIYGPYGFRPSGTFGPPVGNGIDARIHANGEVGTDSSPVFHDGQNGRYDTVDPHSLFGGSNLRFNTARPSYGWW